MALRTAKEWSVWLSDLELTKEDQTVYSTALHREEITEKDLKSFDHELLKVCGVNKYGHRTRILRKAGESEPKNESTTPETHFKKKACAIPRPSIQKGATQLEFEQFVHEWKQFKNYYKFVDKQEVETQLTFCCSKDIRSRILEVRESLSPYDEKDLIDIIKDLCLSKVSRLLHIQKFLVLKQEESESCEDFYGRLCTMASCCKFDCPHCGKSNSKERVREKFVLGLKDKALQTKILCSETHKPDITLEKLLQEAITLEQSVREQKSLSQNPTSVEVVHNLNTRVDTDDSNEEGNSDEYLSANSLKFKRRGNNQRFPPKKGFPLCPRCGTSSHAIYTTSEKCSAWGKNCRKCGGKNHFAKMCKQKSSNRSNNQRRNNSPDSSQRSAQHLELFCMSCLSKEKSTTNTMLIEIKVQLLVNGKKSHPIKMKAFPDTGANVCLFGPEQLKRLAISSDMLTKCHTCITVAGGSSITATGFCEIQISLGKRASHCQAYFCKKADRFYIQKQSCKDLNIVPQTFPYPPDFNCNDGDDSKAISLVERSNAPPKRPNNIPYKPCEQNISKLNAYLREKFQSSAFNKSKPFPKLTTPPARIHLKPDFVIPKPAFCPSSVAEHWSEQVHNSLEADVAAGVLKKVPFNEPTVWCARMVVVRKKDGRPRRTVDFQSLNAQCLREPNHQDSPFHTARKIPQNTWKTVIDFVDGYHSVALDEESSKLTTFVTPWGRYRYLRFPQGHCAAGDAFNGRIQLIFSKVPRMVRIVDDICLYDDSVEAAFWHAWDVLTLCAENGVVVNSDKFQFCSRDVDFAGLSVSSNGVLPSRKLLAAIKNFPPPTDLTKARAFFGLVNQLQWAYANSKDMAPFRDLVRPRSVFKWDDSMKTLFETCKQKILSQVYDGVVKYDLERYTCIQTDFSQEGLGYLLLQKHCDCSLDQAPLCCKEGWKLVCAGSRFTKGAESKYPPTHGEALAVSWALNHARIFTLGCPRLIISTDHEPLLGILNNKPLDKLTNPRLVKFKESIMSFSPFTIKYNKGKWHRGPDALSRSPQLQYIQFEALMMFANEDSMVEIGEDPGFYAELAIARLESDADNDFSLSSHEVRRVMLNDPEMLSLKSAIENGFPSTHHLTDPSLRQYFNIRNDLWIQNDIIMFKDRVVIPTSLRTQVVNLLHSAHQGIEGMRSRAVNAVYWPGLNSSIREKRRNCSVCEKIAPSQTREPLQLFPHAEYPFEQICMDAFEMEGHHYSVVVDRFSSWLLVFHYRNPPQAKHIILTLRSVFTTYGAPKTLFSDGGLPFQALEVKEFLQRWEVTHVTSSASYPQANGRAELAVKTAKRLLQENMNRDGSLNCDSVSRALLQYRNTPIKHLGLSPAQILFHRDLKDQLPIDPRKLKPHKQWIDAAMRREEAFSSRNSMLTQQYNLGTRFHSVIPIGYNVLIQDTGSISKHRWNKSGTVVEREGRKYLIRMHGSGRIISRNRKHIKTTSAELSTKPDEPLPFFLTAPESETPHSPLSSPIRYQSSTQSTNITPQVAKTPLMLKRLRPFNNPGRSEQN
jgi:hypothetical protein